MKKILVFGGSRFFGKKAIELLLTQGHEITIANRGLSMDNFGDKVTRVTVDRTSPEHPGWKEITKTNWDVVIDNICFNQADAQIATKYLGGKVKQYLFTSTLSVYSGEGSGPTGGYLETDFDPKNYEIDPQKAIDYSEGKRQAEAYFEEVQAFPLTTLRIPIVLDRDDYTERLLFYIQHNLREEQVVVRNLDARMSYIKGSEVARLMQWCIETETLGIVNASSTDPIKLGDLFTLITDVTGKPMIYEHKPLAESASPFAVESDWFMDVSRIEVAGFKQISLESWLPELIEYYVEMVQKDENGVA